MRERYKIIDSIKHGTRQHMENDTQGRIAMKVRTFQSGTPFLIVDFRGDFYFYTISCQYILSLGALRILAGTGFFSMDLWVFRKACL